MLLHAEPANPPLFRRDAAVLVDAIAGLSAAHARRAVDYWQQAASPDAAEAAERDAHQQRRLHVSEMAGMVHIDGRLTREGGEVVLTALRSITDPGLLDPGDTRTGAQRRADALVDLCADHLAHGEAPSSGGHRPQVVVTLALEALEARAGGPCELDETGVITPETARRLACDAAVTRVITGAGSEAINVGRATRVPPAATRTALVIRDRGCTIAGCGRPHRWCDAHHLVHWADGGPTDLDNLSLVGLMPLTWVAGPASQPAWTGIGSCNNSQPSLTGASVSMALPGRGVGRQHARPAKVGA
jgi:hypothetical protein